MAFTINTMNRTTVKDVIKSRGTRFVTVKFLKKDGSQRVINGLLRPSSKIKGNAGNGNIALKNQGYVPIYSVTENAWKTFHLDSVLEIN